MPECQRLLKLLIRQGCSTLSHYDLVPQRICTKRNRIIPIDTSYQSMKFDVNMSKDNQVIEKSVQMFTDRRTSRQTDGRTDGHCQNINPPELLLQSRQKKSTTVLLENSVKRLEIEVYVHKMHF